ncbi:hypothetical protein KKF61_08855 [Patescibacteria group bacterium]|nr:hypothetical protein [Patescibacteria group bacterium]
MQEMKNYTIDFVDLRNKKYFYHVISAESENKAILGFRRYMLKNDSSIEGRDYKIESIKCERKAFVSGW